MLVCRTFLVLCLSLAAGLGCSRAADFSIALSGDLAALPTVIAPGGSATFSYAATPVPAGPFQWYFNDTPLASATTATLTLTGVTAAQTGNYRLHFTPASGPAQWSNTLTLNVVTPPPSPVDAAFSAAPPANAIRTAPPRKIAAADTQRPARKPASLRPMPDRIKDVT